MHFLSKENRKISIKITKKILKSLRSIGLRPSSLRFKSTNFVVFLKRLRHNCHNLSFYCVFLKRTKSSVVIGNVRYLPPCSEPKGAIYANYRCPRKRTAEGAKNATITVFIHFIYAVRGQSNSNSCPGGLNRVFGRCWRSSSEVMGLIFQCPSRLNVSQSLTPFGSGTTIRTGQKLL